MLTNILYPQSPDQNKIFSNPFLTKRHYPIKFIKEVKANQHQAGDTDHPENIIINFKVTGEGGLMFPNIPDKNFHYSIRQNKQTYQVKADTSYRGDSYFARLKMPKVDMGGNYDFQISVDSGTFPDSRKKIAKTMVDFFQYRQRKTDVVFLIDNSGSMNRNDPNRIRYQAIYRVLKNPKFSNKIDEIAVLSFSETAQVIFPFGKVAKFLQKRILPFGRGNTDFSKPFLVVDKLIRENRINDLDQKAIIFLTDGVANFPYAEEHLKMRNLGVPVYTVGLFKKKTKKEYQPVFLQKIARETRGEFFEANPDVLGRVFEKFIDHSSTPGREFMVFPLKSDYAYNELIHINYRASSDYEKKLRFNASFQYLNQWEKADIYRRESGRITLHPLYSLGGGNLDEKPTELKGKLSLQLVFSLGEIPLFDDIIELGFGKNPDLAVKDLIYFQQIDFHNYDIRYFQIENNSRQSIFADILIPSLELESPVVFKETPFLLESGKTISQSVVFYPAKNVKPGGNRVLDFILETSQGDFLNRINYNFLSRVKKSTSLPVSYSNFSSSLKKGWFYVFIIINIFFIFLFSLHLKKTKGRKTNN